MSCRLDRDKKENEQGSQIAKVLKHSKPKQPNQKGHRFFTYIFLLNTEQIHCVGKNNHQEELYDTTMIQII